MPDHLSELKDLISFRNELSQHLDRARNAWFWQAGSHYRAAAGLLCFKLTILGDRPDIWNNIPRVSVDEFTFPSVLAGVMGDLGEVLRKTGTRDQDAGRLIGDVLRQLDRLEQPDFHGRGEELRLMVQRAALKVCEIEKGGNVLKQAWVAGKAAALVSGAAVVVLGLAAGEPNLIIFGAGIVLSNAKLIIEGADRLFPAG